MKHVLFLAFVAVIIAASALVLQKSFLEEPDAVAPQEEEITGHTLKSINLVQGRDGMTIWRLKAPSGTMQQADGLISLEAPDILYYIQPDNKEIRIMAKKGEIIQHDQHVVRLWDNVTALHEDSRLNAGRMLYSTENRVMIFDQGATITGETLYTEAARMEWDTKTDIIYGLEGVRVIYTPQAHP